VVRVVMAVSREAEGVEPARPWRSSGTRSMVSAAAEASRAHKVHGCEDGGSCELSSLADVVAILGRMSSELGSS
jgi:hypothetical protein